MTDLDKAMQAALSVAREYYETNEYLMPICLFETEDKVVHVTIDVEDADQKELSLRIIRELLVTTSAEYYIIMSEAWGAPPSEDPPSENPLRREMLIINGVERKGGKRCMVFRIFRDEMGAVKELKDEGIKIFSGRFFELFEPEGMAGRA